MFKNNFVGDQAIQNPFIILPGPVAKRLFVLMHLVEVKNKRLTLLRARTKTGFCVIRVQNVRKRNEKYSFPFVRPVWVVFFGRVSRQQWCWGVDVGGKLNSGPIKKQQEVKTRLVFRYNMVPFFNTFYSCASYDCLDFAQHCL